MKSLLKSSILLAALCVSACSNLTTIDDLGLPPVTIIQGAVQSATASGFVLKDKTGSVYVKTEMADSKPVVSVKEIVTVYGNLEGGTERIFDGYVIKKNNGQQVIITEPTPHVGCVLQSKF